MLGYSIKGTDPQSPRLVGNLRNEHMTNHSSRLGTSTLLMFIQFKEYKLEKTICILALRWIRGLYHCDTDLVLHLISS